MLPESAPSLIDCAGRLPMQARERVDVKRMRSTFLYHQHGGKAAAKGIAKFEKAVRAHPCDVSQNNPAPMQLGKDFLIDAGMFILLMTIDDNHAVTEFAFNNRLHNDIEERLHCTVVYMFWIKQSNDERRRRLKIF